MKYTKYIITLLFLAITGFAFYSMDVAKYFTLSKYALFFLIYLLPVPFLFIKKGVYLRPVFLLVSLALFGFLQMACQKPVGIIEYLTLGFLHGKTYWHLIFKVMGVITISVIFARYYCGWFCPKGAIQEFIHSKRISFKVPPKIDNVLKYGKYVTLVLLVAWPFLFDAKLFREVGPFKVIFNLDGSLFLVIFLAIVLLSSVFIERAYCRYFCPFGGLLSILSVFSLKKLTVDKSLCVNCNKCVSTCPVDAINKAKDRKTECISFNHKECITCLECRNVCSKGAIKY